MLGSHSQPSREQPAEQQRERLVQVQHLQRVEWQWLRPAGSMPSQHTAAQFPQSLRSLSCELRTEAVAFMHLECAQRIAAPERQAAAFPGSAVGLPEPRARGSLGVLGI